METPPPSKKNEAVIPKRSEESQTSICKKLKLSSQHDHYFYFTIYAISFYEYQCLVYEAFNLCFCLQLLISIFDMRKFGDFRPKKN